MKLVLMTSAIQLFATALLWLCNSASSLSLPAASSISSKKFPRTYVPIASTFELDPDRPTPVEFFGQRYVVYQDNSEKWVVMDDSCSHRRAPLSEGRVDRTSGTLMCSYHGWEYDSSGKCTRIPQLNPEMEKSATSSTRACVSAYPAVVEKNILWMWPWEEDVLSVAGDPMAHPEGMMKGLPSNPSTYTRDLPYGWDTLIENLIDPSHVPFAHHGMQGKRTDAIPINMTIPKDLGANGFSFEWDDRTMGMMRSGDGEFRAPYIVNYDGTFKTEKPRPFNLAAVCIPTKPGWSRGIIMTGSGEEEEEDLEKKKKSSLLKKVFSILPVWLIHQLSNRFLDSDLAFLHFQEKERGYRPDYYMPAPADRCISALRNWVSKYTDIQEPLPPTLPRKVMFDRFEQHTSHCKHCQSGLETLKKTRNYTYVALALSVLGINFRIAKVSTVLCLAALRCIQKLENSFREGEFKHYENH